jgi:hypothetical protein
MLRALLKAGVRRMVVCDPKAETVALCKRVIIDVARSLPSAEAEDLLRRVVCLDVFSADTLPRLQLLAAKPGEDIELQAYAVARLITEEADMAVGVRQEAILHRLVECLIRTGLPLTALPDLLQKPHLLEALAEGHAAVDLLRGVAVRLKTESAERLGGISARVERLLRLRSTRLALGGAPDCLDVGRLLDDRIVLVNLEPPTGSVDVGRFLCGILWVLLTQAIRRRPNGSPPAILVLEEWPAFLSAAQSGTADACEDILRLARAKGVYLYLLAQDLASVGKVSSTLPTVVKTNVMLHAIFRTTDSDWSAFLPVTGRRRKTDTAPWEERRTVYLDRGAELTLLKEELARLPDRTCYLLDRRSGIPAALMRTADLTLRATDAEVRALESRAAKSDAVLSLSDLEQGQESVRRRLAQLEKRESASAPVLPLRRRGPRPVEIG